MDTVKRKASYQIVHSNGLIDHVRADFYMIRPSIAFYLFCNHVNHNTLWGKLFCRNWEEVARFKSVTAIIRHERI